MKTNKKLPPYGSILAERQKFLNLPFLAIVCVGQDAWNSAKRWNARGNNCALVLPADLKPEACIWPVSRCTCVIEWNAGPHSNLIVNLAKCLLLAHAKTVIVWPKFVDHKAPVVTYDETKEPGQRWVQCRETIRVYHNQTGVDHVHA